MPVYFKKGTDTGEAASVTSIEPITNGEPLNQTTLRRPVEHLRARTDELRRVVSEIELHNDLLRNLTVRTIDTDPNRQVYRGAATVGGDADFLASPQRAEIEESTLSLRGRIVRGSYVPGSKVYGTNAVGDRWTNPFGYPYVLGYGVELPSSGALLLSSPALSTSKVVLNSAAVSNFYNNYVDDAGGLLGYTDPSQPR